MGGRLEAIAGSAEVLLRGTEAGGEERVEKQAFQDGDWCVVLYTDGTDTEENWWYRQEGGATGAETLSQGTDLLWHLWTPAGAAGRCLWAVEQGWAAMAAEARAGISPRLLYLLGGVGGKNKS